MDHNPLTMKCLVQISMYNEKFYQFLQTMAGVIRNIAELEHHDPETYKGRIGVVLVCDGSDKVDSDFYIKANNFGLIDFDVLYDNAFDPDAHDEKTLREFPKLKTMETKVNKNYLDYLD